eukprot:2058968-Alexandrium_andersonii.AAC.1
MHAQTGVIARNTICNDRREECPCRRGCDRAAMCVPVRRVPHSDDRRQGAGRASKSQEGLIRP